MSPLRRSTASWRRLDGRRYGCALRQLRRLAGWRRAICSATVAAVHRRRLGGGRARRGGGQAPRHRHPRSRGGRRRAHPRAPAISSSPGPRISTALKGSAAVLDVGRFSPVPTPADLQRVTFDDHSLDLRDCRPGDCHGAAQRRRHRALSPEVNWTGARLAEPVRQGLAGRSSRATPPPISRNGRHGASRLRQQARGAERRLGSLAADQRVRRSCRRYSPELARLPAGLRPRIRRRARSRCSTGPGKTSGSGRFFRISHQVILQASGRLRRRSSPPTRSTPITIWTRR